MFPSLSIIIPHVPICSHDHLLFSIIFHYYQLQIFIIINDDYLLLLLLFFIIHDYYSWSLFIIIFIYIPYSPVLSPCFSFMIPWPFYVEPPWISSKNIRQVLQLETAMGAAIQCPEPWVSRHFPLGKAGLSLEDVGTVWEKMGKYRKIMGKDEKIMGKLWDKMGKYGIIMGKLEYLLGGWWFAPGFCGL